MMLKSRLKNCPVKCFDFLIFKTKLSFSGFNLLLLVRKEYAMIQAWSSFNRLKQLLPQMASMI